MKKDIGQILAYTIGRALTVLANWWFIIRTSVHSSIIPKDYSINNLVVNYADNEQIERHSLEIQNISAIMQVNKIPSLSEPSFNFLIS
ncbi:MAG: hypothetical protein V3V14_10465, partial [Saprospiraceae bacterium]